MTKSELSLELSTKANLNYSLAEKIVQEIFSSMADTLVAGDRIEIRGFGSFDVRE